MGEFVPDDDNATIAVDNVSNVNWLDEPFLCKMYDDVWAQMDGGAQRTVTNNPNFLKNIQWYTKTFRLKHSMKGATSAIASLFLKREAIYKSQLFRVEK